MSLFLSKAALKKLEKLSQIHREDFPQIVILLFVMQNKVKDCFGNVEDEYDFMMGGRYMDYDCVSIPLLVCCFYSNQHLSIISNK